MHVIFASAAAAALLFPTFAAAQEQPPPARLGDIWNGQDHVLPPGQIHAQEKSAGVALSPAQQRGQTDEVEQLEKQVLQGARHGPGAPPAP